jgi:hypothetical protein
MNSVALQIGEWAFWRVHGQLMEIRAAEMAQLRVDIGRETPLQQRVYTKMPSECTAYRPALPR